MAKKKDRIATEGHKGALGDNPFGALDAQSLDLAENKPSPVLPKKTVTPQKKRGRVDVRREKSGRGGKWVTVLQGDGFLKTSPQELEALLSQFKKQLGCGGALKGKTLEVQGDKCELVMDVLKQKGYQPVRCGG
tara:strand:- start:39082 stop:39483 length:402 start_codon:yes stop_codon:yes gene_type:complete